MRELWLLVTLSGCYAELGAAYLPSVKQTVTDPIAMTETTSKTHGWGVDFKLGFYLDIPIRPARTAIGIGYSPDSFGGDPVLPSDAPAKVTPKGTSLRGDIALPFIPIRSAPDVLVRLTAIRTKFSAVGVKMAPDDNYENMEHASGTGWFIG